SRENARGTGARTSLTFSPSTGASHTPNPATPASQSGFASSQTRHDTGVLQSLAGLTGATVVLLTKTGQRLEGIVASTSGQGDTTGVALKDVKDITNPGATLKNYHFIALTNIESWASGPADSRPSNGDTFRTDTDIGQKKGPVRERELQAWQPGADVPNLTQDEAFNTTGNVSWDQFAINEKLFANFDEDAYTTRLDRSAPDYKEKERKALRIASEILGTATTNLHVLEERGHIVEDTDSNEEKFVFHMLSEAVSVIIYNRYGAVVRGSNAYISPLARKQAAMGSTTAINAPKAEAPKIAVNGPDDIPTPPSKTSTPAPVAAPSATSQVPTNKPPVDPLPAFNDFVVNEKHRLTQKRQALVRSEMDKKTSELMKFGQSFKLNKPIPEDIVPILAKDEEKQRAIREKAILDAQSSQARSIGLPSPANATRGIPPNVKPDASRKLAAVAKTNKVDKSIQTADVSVKVYADADIQAQLDPQLRSNSSALSSLLTILREKKNHLSVVSSM
ncbi:LsmAD domain-containing protein, partial [Amanita rubescens]